MNNVKAQFHKASDESIETTREVLKTSLASVEKLTKINLEASKRFLTETTKALKEMSGVKNPKELFEKVNKLATHTVESNMSSCRDVYDVITETQNKIKKMLESHIQAAQKNITAATENFSKLNSGAKSAFSADSIKKWLNTTNEAMEALNKMTSQASNRFTGAKTTTTAKPTATKASASSSAKTNAFPGITRPPVKAKASTAKKVTRPKTGVVKKTVKK